MSTSKTSKVSRATEQRCHHWGHALYLRRYARRLKEHEVAVAIGVSRPHYANIEAGRRCPSRDVAEALAKFYDTTVAHLFPGLTTSWRRSRVLK